MILTPLSSYLYCTDMIGSTVSMNIDNIKAIQISLNADGGIIRLVSAYLEGRKNDGYWINYTTLDARIRLSFELSKADYQHNLDFFGGFEVRYDDPIKFDLDNNKFKLP